MPAILQSNKEEKWLRVSMLAKQGIITWEQALLMYMEYCRVYEKITK